jgi:hypothetical protein
MELWAKNEHATQPFYYALDHKYTQANISLIGLKARDRACAQQLQTVCRELGFEIFLATLEREDDGTAEDYDDDPWEYHRDNRRYRYYGCCEEENEDEDEEDKNDEKDDDENDKNDEKKYHAIDEVTESKLTAKFVYDLSGNEIMSSIRLTKDDILQEDPFGEDPDEEDYEGYMGNSVGSYSDRIEARNSADS